MRRRKEMLGFAVLCLLAGSRWLMVSAFPSTLQPLFEQGLYFGLAAVLSLLLWLMRRSAHGWIRSVLWPQLAAAGMACFGLPILLCEAAQTAATASGTALFALAPLFLVVGAASFGFEPDGRALMAPALAGISGALLLLPFRLPATTREGLLFFVVFLAMLFTVAGSLWLYALLRRSCLMPAAVAVFGANAVLLLSASLIGHRNSVAGVDGTTLIRACYDLPQLFLLLWLLRQITPTRLGARFLLIPMIAVVEGLFLLRPSLDLRSVAGMLLISGGGLVLLFQHREEGNETVSSLGLR